MNNISGILIRKEDYIQIKLNKAESGKIFYKNKLEEKEIFLMDFYNKNTIKFKDPKPLNRIFYKIVCKSGELILAERILPLEKFSNFRDLGGYIDKKGRMIKWGLFYRSEDLSNLKNDDLKYFETLGIKYVLDYRSKEEVLENPDIQVKGVKNINISGMNIEEKISKSENLDMISYISEILKGKEITITPEQLLKDAYKNMPINNPAYKELFELFKNPKNTAILQHCTAGKDRTGIGSALLLLALGIDEETVIEDYLQSNENREQFNKKVINMCSNYIKDEKTKKLIEEILGVNRSFIQLSLNAIKNKYETYENYFEKEYGLTSFDLEELKDFYMYK